ncbi:hypothetical protein JCM3765_004823 [Sporobolomyces pararoseus]
MSIPSSSSATSSVPQFTSTSASSIPSNPHASISGSLYLSRLSRFIQTHERALAAYYPPPTPRRQTTPQEGGGPSWSTILSLGILPSSTSTSSSSPSTSPLPPNDRLVLSFDPHHLYYILLKFDELGFSTGDSLDIKLSSSDGGKDFTKPLLLDHTSTTTTTDGAIGRLEIIREGNSFGKTQSLFSGFFGNNHSTTNSPPPSRKEDDSKSFSQSSSFSFGSGWWGLGGGESSTTIPKEQPQQQDESSLVKHIYSSCTKLPALKLSPFIFQPPNSSNRAFGSSLPFEAVSGFEDCPPPFTCVPLSIFHSLTSLYLQDLDPRSFTGWDKISIGLKKLQIVRSGIEDVCELICDCVVEDEQRSLRKKNGETLSQEFVGQIRNKRTNTTTTQEAVTSGCYPKPSKLAWSSLRHLSLHDNSLTFIPLEPLTHLTLLTSLDLSSNLLISVPPSLSQLPFLRSLNLRDNMIDNLHSLPTILGAVEVLNLSQNRLENLSGLDRLLALERLDLRENRVWECLEISRLSRLKNLKELWVERNPFSRGIEQGGEESWRIKCWSYFLEERAQDVEEDDEDLMIKIDGRGINGRSERKLVELEVEKRTGGNFKQRVRRRASTTRLKEQNHSTSSTTNGGVLPKKVVVEPRRRVVTAPNLDHHNHQRQTSSTSTQQLSTSPNLSSSPTRPSQSHHHHHQQQQRRKPRRIVDLDTPPSSTIITPSSNNVRAQQSDSDATTDATSSGPESSRNLPLIPPSTMLTPSKVRQQQQQQKFNSSPSRIRHSPNLIIINNNEDNQETNSSLRATTTRRDRISTSTFEDSLNPQVSSELMTPVNSGASGAAAGGGGGEALRKKIEKLREEVGENWLSVLGEREARAAALLQVEQERKQRQQQEEEDESNQTRVGGKAESSGAGQTDPERELERSQREEPSIEGLTVSAGVKVVKKKGKKKKGKGGK